MRTGWLNVFHCCTMLSPAENSLWIPLLCHLGVSVVIHATKMAQPSCSVMACMGLITQTVGFGTHVQPSSLCSYLGLVLHYNWYYSTIYNIYWCLILLCDGRVVSDQKNLKSKQDLCSKKALHADENVCQLMQVSCVHRG